jgi:hypothetical protein
MTHYLQNNVSLLFLHINSKLTGYHIVLGTLKLSTKYTRAFTTCIGTIHCHSIWQCAKMQEGDANCYGELFRFSMDIAVISLIIVYCLVPYRTESNRFYISCARSALSGIICCVSHVTKPAKASSSISVMCYDSQNLRQW